MSSVFKRGNWVPPTNLTVKTLEMKAAQEKIISPCQKQKKVDWQSFYMLAIAIISKSHTYHEQTLLVLSSSFVIAFGTALIFLKHLYTRNYVNWNNIYYVYA